MRFRCVIRGHRTLRTSCELGLRDKLLATAIFGRDASSSSNRWQNRQGKDRFARDAKVQGLKSRAAFKLLEINEKFKIFSKGQTVVDLGYAPGSWSQVAFDRTSPGGRVIGIDILPVQPPKGVSTIQGNFLSPHVQNQVREFLSNPERGRPRREKLLSAEAAERGMTEADLVSKAHEPEPRVTSQSADDRMVDVVLSDMMMNTSGMSFRDHAGSMDLCNAALSFAFDSLRSGGSFVCKFYQGNEDKVLEARLKALFAKVHREKPEASRGESREAYFVALRRKEGVERQTVFGEES